MTQMEFFDQCKKVPIVEYARHFSSFRKRAFRLELLECYEVASETSFLDLYRKDSAHCPNEFNLEWLSILEGAAKRGATVERVRLIPRGELPEYMRFEFQWGYERSLTWGEKIYTIYQSGLSDAKGLTPILNDYWLFDDNSCFLMQYDFYGRFMGVLEAPSDSLDSFSSLKSALLDCAKPLR